MRQLLISLFILSSFSSAFALSDLEAKNAADLTISRIERMQDKKQRLNEAIKFNVWISDKLDKDALAFSEDVLKLPDNHPTIEKYRSLTEYGSYIEIIVTQLYAGKDCKRALAEVENSTSVEGGSVPEAGEAVKILTAICR